MELDHVILVVVHFHRYFAQWVIVGAHVVNGKHVAFHLNLHSFYRGFIFKFYNFKVFLIFCVTGCANNKI